MLFVDVETPGTALRLIFCLVRFFFDNIQDMFDFLGIA